MTPVQVRMARAALALTVGQLASRAALQVEAVEMIERGTGRPDAAAKLRTTLESAGVEFLGEDGVRFHAESLGAAQTVPLEQLNSANDE